MVDWLEVCFWPCLPYSYRAMERQIHILAADALAEEGLEFIREQPDTVLAHKPGLSAAELSAIIGDYDGLIVRSGVQITSEVLASSGKLRAIRNTLSISDWPFAPSLNSIFTSYLVTTS